MLTVNNLSFNLANEFFVDDVNTTFTHGNIYGLSDQWSWKINIS
jgi:hypothetical protein